jgi:4-diphosphocytidyl-2-C-methyl-D-erythritol kinase
MPRWWPAPAKLNLYLHVTGRRDDGFHLLDSLVAFADIADRVAVTAAPRLSLAIEGPFASGLLANDTSNLVWRAAAALAQRLGRAPDVALTLEKNLPIASGIGGGSSDAAATLKALAALWQMDDDKLLAEVGAGLGADVPVCLAAKTSWLGGIGERVEPAPALPPVPLVLVNPNIALPTPGVFKARRGPFSNAARFTAAPHDVQALVALLAERRNDLTAPAIEQVPVIATVLERLATADGALLARMSGSGATCFAFFSSTTKAEAAAESLRTAEPRWWVTAGRLV